MDILALKDWLTKGKRTVVGIPTVSPTLFSSLLPLFTWALEGNPKEGRQIWFVWEDVKGFRDHLDPTLRSRILPLSVEQGNFCLYSLPSDALLLPEGSVDPNGALAPFWKERGTYSPDRTISGLTLWAWKSKQPPLRLYGIDHHHAVLWDIKQTLRPLGVTLDFVWLCDGRPPVNEAIPSNDPPFFSSLDLYKPPAEFTLDPGFRTRLEQTYDAILSSHSLVTAFRFRDVKRPQFHINSTRFGNSWIAEPEKHKTLVQSIQELLRKKKLQVLHNNLGDALYFHQYFTADSSQECIIPSLCQNMMRQRFKAVTPMKFLIWDTRQVLLQKDKSPFMKTLYQACKFKQADAFDSQAVLLAEKKTFLAEGYLDDYTAVIHIPYNISTMSIFQQVSANIPVWVPSKRLLKELWTDPNECNELSWTIFNPGSEQQASFLDQARNPEVVQLWIDNADFYENRISDCIFTFDSIEELVERIFTVNYQEAMEKNQESFLKRQENTIATWEALLAPLKEIHKN
jgi:hypothetical protein